MYFTVYDAILEVLLCVFVFWVYNRIVKHQKSDKNEISDSELSRILEESTPEPLASSSQINPMQEPERLESADLIYGEMCDSFRDCRIMAKSYDVYNLTNSRCTKKLVLDTIKTYGVGTCGPRGFLGTNDVHRRLERLISQTMGTEDCVVYSYGYATLASVVPAYIKRNDVVFACRNLCPSGIVGLQATGCENIYWFNPDDMAGLETEIKSAYLIADQQINRKNKPQRNRFFFLIEGSSSYGGDLIDLPKIVELRKKYKIRIILDESHSFGVIGKTGKGVTEHFDIPISEIDILTCSMEYSIAAYGGFSTGSRYVIDHQRLSSLAYCFSASLPTFQAELAIFALKQFADKKDSVLKLVDICNYLICLLHQRELTSWKVIPVERREYYSPVKITLCETNEVSSFSDKRDYWRKVHRLCHAYGLELALQEGLEFHSSGISIEPGIQILLQIDHTKTDCESIMKILRMVHSQISRDYI